ncbi:MAG: RNA polymerase sigma factor [Gemmatimonadota bacterium]
MSTKRPTPSTATPSDGAVVRAVLAGQHEFYRLLVRRHQDALYRHADRMLGSADEAADVVQRAFVNGYQKLPRCAEPEKVGGWLFRICANLCKDVLKSRHRKVLSLEAAEVVVSEDESAWERAERAQVRARVKDALVRLPPDQREAFLLKHVEGHSYDEMAELLGASVSALKMRVLRAREELQEILRVCR